MAITARGSTLTLTLPSHYVGRRTWTDGKRAKLEQKLDDVLDNLEFRAALAERRRAERERAEDERQQAMQPLLDRAREDFLRDRQRDALRELAAQWRTVCDIRALCEAAKESTAQDQSDLPPAAWAFARWAEANAGWIDSVGGTPTMPDLPEPGPTDLLPYLAKYDDEMRALR